MNFKRHKMTGRVGGQNRDGWEKAEMERKRSRCTLHFSQLYHLPFPISSFLSFLSFLFIFLYFFFFSLFPPHFIIYCFLLFSHTFYRFLFFSLFCTRSYYPNPSKLLIFFLCSANESIFVLDGYPIKIFPKKLGERTKKQGSKLKIVLCPYCPV